MVYGTCAPCGVRRKSLPFFHLAHPHCKDTCRLPYFALNSSRARGHLSVPQWCAVASGKTGSDGRHFAVILLCGEFSAPFCRPRGTIFTHREDPYLKPERQRWCSHPTLFITKAGESCSRLCEDPHVWNFDCCAAKRTLIDWYLDLSRIAIHLVQSNEERYMLSFLTHVCGTHSATQ
jgi:hypothetical protein